MSKLWKKVSNETDPDKIKADDVQEVALETLTISAPTVIYLPGFASTDGRRKNTGRGLLHVEVLFENLPRPAIYAWSHNKLRDLFDVVAYNNKAEKNYSATAEFLARSVILPLVSRDGKPLPPDEAKKNLRNLTFFGYSTGTVLAQEAFNAGMKLMQDIGYGEKDARETLREVVLIAAGNISRPSQENNRFTTLYLAAGNDLAVWWKNRIWSPLKNVFRWYACPLTIKTLSPTSLFITGKMRRKLWEWRKTAEGTREKYPIRPLLPKFLLIRSYHEFAHYLSTDDEHSPFSKLAQSAIIQATRRTETPDVWQLLEPTEALTAQESFAYRRRLADAVAEKPKQTYISGRNAPVYLPQIPS